MAAMVAILGDDMRQAVEALGAAVGGTSATLGLQKHYLPGDEVSVGVSTSVGLASPCTPARPPLMKVELATPATEVSVRPTPVPPVVLPPLFWRAGVRGRGLAATTGPATVCAGVCCPPPSLTPGLYQNIPETALARCATQHPMFWPILLA
jgi:hypothetical protein